MEEIIEFGVVSSKKRTYLEVATLPVDTLFVNTFKEASEGVELSLECLNIMDDFNKRL